MPLSNKDLSDIAQEFSAAKGEQDSAKSSIPNVQSQVDDKQKQVDRMYIMYNDAHVERVTPYETEHRWLDGTTYTTITKSQIETFSTDTGKNSYFYPTGWQKSNAILQPNGNGNPKTSSPNSESAVLNAALENNGLIATVSWIRNGQTSSAPSRTLDTAYSPGSSTLSFSTSHSFTIGKYLYVSGSGTSALVKVTGSTSLTVTISEIIAPASTIAIGGTVIESIPGFTNIERQNLTSSQYQRILTQLTNNIVSAATLYNTALQNQLDQLKINIDAASEVTAANTSVTNAQTAYSTWNALSSTGVNGKFTDTALTNFASSYNSRNSGISARVSQITTALGSVTQDGDGNYGGSGNYLQRYKCMNFLINGTNGPLQAIFGLKSVKGSFEQKIANNVDKLATFSNLVHYTAFTKDPSGNSVEVDAANLFSPGDTVLLSGKDLPGIECTVSSISGKSIVLSLAIPATYNKAAKAGIIKRI